MFVNYLIGFFVFIFGLCVGSFLNCAIYRLEKGKSLNGRSFCPHCKHALSWQDLFPVFSFFFLGGRCRYCQKKISSQYPLVELFTGFLFVLIFVFQAPNLRFHDLMALCFMFYVSCAMMIIFIYDLKHYLIPDAVLLPAIIITSILRIFDFAFWVSAPLLNYIFAALIATGLFFIIWLISGGRWMGFGDVKLAVLMGLLLGFPNVLLALFLAFFFGAIIGIMLMGFEKKSLKSEIPFGPFLIIGTFIALFWGNQLMSWYFNLLI